MSDWRVEIEQAVWAAARIGAVCDLTGRPESERVVPTELIHELCTSATDVHPRGVWIVGAQIDDSIDFRYARLTVPVHLINCKLRSAPALKGAVTRTVAVVGGEVTSGAIDMTGATIEGELNLRGMQLTGTDQLGNALVADRLRVTDNVSLDRGFVAAGAVRLVGARIEGQLILSGAELTGTDQVGTALYADGLGVAAGAFLKGFASTGGIRLVGATIEGELNLGAGLTGTDQAGNALSAARLRVTGGLFLDKGFAAAGAVRLTGARIDGPLNLGRAELNALTADRLRVTDKVDFGQGFTAAGAVRLFGAAIEGPLNLGDAQLTGADADGNALIADGLRVTDSVDFGQGFTAAGAVRLVDARIEGQLRLGHAQLTGTDHLGNALIADRLRVTTDVNGRFTAAGAVRLVSAAIEGQLNLAGADLTGTDQDGTALFADGLRVTGNVFMDDGFTAAGAVRIPGAAVEGQLILRGAQLTGTDQDGDALIADRLRVGKATYLDGGLAAVGGVSLVGADCGVLWPGEEGPRLTLRAIRFAGVGGVEGWERHRKWIQRQGWVDWSPDPYEQVVAAYLRSGDEESARRLRIARADDELHHLKVTRAQGTRRYRFWRRGFGVLVGYGYKRYRAGWALVVTVVAAALMFGWAEREGAMVPNAPPDEFQSSCGNDYPCFNAIVYGVDVVLPIVDLGQDSAWRPIEVDTATRVGGLNPGGWWVTARWMFIALGWILASVFVSAFTSLVQRS